MIRIWKHANNELVSITAPAKDCWIEVTNPSPAEIDRLRHELYVPEDFINDSLDTDERARSEMGKKWLLLLLRIPVHQPGHEEPYQTVPLGILASRDHIITICVTESAMMNDFMLKRAKYANPAERPVFILYLFLRSATFYLNYLKEIHKQTMIIEQILEKSLKNNELIKLMRMEKSLVYFMTSLKSNELLIEKLKRARFTNVDDLPRELLEDALIENKQASEMAGIYANILNGMMDTFGSLISNNLNETMKQLTSITLILMVPTLIASIYGMNIALPLQQHPYAAVFVICGSLLLSLSGIYIFRRRDWF